MSLQFPYPPKAPTDSLRLESFKTLSRLQLIFEFQPWLQYSIEYTRRRVNSPYFQLWDCLCFGAPLNTLLELVGSPTPRQLSVTADEFDFNLSADERGRYFSSFIRRVQALENQGRLPFGEVLKVNDFMDGQSAGFSRILRTVNRILFTLDASYPGLFTVPHGSDARRFSLIQQLIETEKIHVGKLATTADFCSLLYEDPTASHVSLECFIVSCSRLVPYHDHVLRCLLESSEQACFEPWFYITAFQNQVFFTQMRISYHSLCTNYLSFHNFLSKTVLKADQLKLGWDILRNLSSILCRFSEYQRVLHSILNATAPNDQQSYDELCTMTHESSNIADALNNAGMELRTMTTHTTLSPRLKLTKQLNIIDDAGTLLLDDCLIINSSTGEYYSVFLFQTTILCCRDHRQSDNINLESTRYPIRSWEMGPALGARYPLQIVKTIPTSELRTLECIDDEYFAFSWGVNEQNSITFFPTIHPQFTQWTSALEPFVSRVVHLSSPKLQAQTAAAAGSVYSRPESFLSLQGDKFSTLRRSSIARPWSLIGRKGNRSSASSFVNVDIGDKMSILSSNMLPNLFTGNLPKSPLGRLFGRGEPAQPQSANSVLASGSGETILTESPTEETPPLSATNWVFGTSVADLTGKITKKGYFPVAHGGYSDLWHGLWKKGDGAEIEVAVKVLRATTDDRELTKKVKKLEHEVEVWKQFSHPNVLQLLGLVSDFGSYMSMVCPWLKNGSITKYLERCGDIIGVEDRLKMICEVADGLCHLHSHSVVHGDLSGANILIDDDGHARICDFGMSVLLDQPNQNTEFEDSDSQLAGSVRWADTTLFQNLEEDTMPPLTPVNDISSLGSVMFEILSGRIPYHYIRTDAQVVVQLHQGVRPRRPAISFISDSQWDLIQLCWDSTVQNRPSAAETLILAKGLLDVYTRPPTHSSPVMTIVSPVRKSA
ncbi:hypothetical protein CPB83DRAFT_858745 [Crepidotus variabilis]|uniref:Protein kinase domain-containing protein n=1 Tax=Crepidotus variabilis TaxID=179855 RepID=A0A9P6EB82_9AGAR|nr:hypothetical protein CPB83DRAFT_858745 [Crepidotus variabilis]